MKQFFLIAVVACLIGNLARAEQVSIPNTSITFNAPDGFTPLTADEIATKYPSINAPKFVVGNERRATTIAYELKPLPLTTNQLGAAKKSIEETFERVILGLVWKERKFIDLSGQKWIYIEMSSNAIDTDIHNIMLATSYKGKMLVFNFNSTKEEFAKYEQSLRESLKSISVK